MLDRFDIALLNAVQRDDSQTAESLAQTVPLSSSTIARRLRRLRADGWILRTIALLSPRLRTKRLRALIFLVLGEHADGHAKAALSARLVSAPEVQLVYALAGPIDMAVLIDCPTMDRFNELTEQVLMVDSTVRRYETHFIKRELKFEPFVKLAAS